ncbi:hypothetical protein [Streptomyces sp. KLMMK]|uniref:hypothetical protein n=1 Tax=Streptomyces sp. KLMMK TaxID=3109353 RepID=UPI003009BB7C
MDSGAHGGCEVRLVRRGFARRELAGVHARRTPGRCEGVQGSALRLAAGSGAGRERAPVEDEHAGPAAGQHPRHASPVHVRAGAGAAL